MDAVRVCLLIVAELVFMVKHALVPDMYNVKVVGDGMPISNADGNHDIGIGLHNVVNRGLGGSSNDPMSSSCPADIDNGEVAGDGMPIGNADGNHDICELDSHPTAVIHVMIVNLRMTTYEDEKLIVKDPPVKQHVDAFIDEQEDKTTVFLENVKHESNKSQYFNVVKDDYKPCLASVFSNVKPKRKKRVTRAFWLGLACLDPAKDGWLHDSRTGADWAMVSPNFSPSILGGTMPDYYFNGVRYPVAWSDVKKVYFSVNEPKKHWCLAELHISNGVVTFYDSLGYVFGNRRPWWRTMK
ncbi:phospholipase-like protein [Tanacetum coccineum]